MNDKPLLGVTFTFILGILVANLLHIPFFYVYPLTLAVAVFSFIFLRRSSFHLYLITLLLGLTLTSLFLSFNPPENYAPGFFKFFTPLSGRIENIFDKTVDNPDNLALIKGLILGKRELVSWKIQEAFKSTGTFHILAISGLHVGLLGAIFFFFFQLLRLSRKFSALLTIFFIAVYALMVLTNGFYPSVVRAALMSILFFIGMILERERNVLNTLSFAALVLLIFNPLLLFQSGFQLSFLAVFSLILLTPKISIWIGKLFPGLNERFTAFVSGLMAVQLGLMPLLAFHFNLLSPIAILANFFVIPLLGLILKISFYSILFGLLYMPLARIFNAANGILLDILRGLISFFSRIPFASFHLHSPSFLTVVTYYSLVFVAFFHNEFRELKINRRKILLIVLILVNLVVWVQVIKPGPNILQVNFVDVGQGDAIFIQFPKGGNLLIDGGKIEEGRKRLKPYLWRKGVKKIDVMVLTHPDSDHLGGLIPVLKGFRVGMVLDPGLVHTSSFYKEFLELIDKKNIPYELISQGDKINGFSPVEIKVLHPGLPLLSGRGDFNNNSVVIVMEYQKVRFLFTADVLREGEQRLMERNTDLEAQILKIPHHGGRSSADRDFFKIVNPQIVIICCGLNNTYGHPHSETLEMLKETGVKIYRTDLNGTVIIRTNGRRIWVKTEK